MNVHRRVLLALALVVTGAGSASADDVAGIWSAQVRSKGGLGYQWTFKDGEAALTFGALVDFKYTIEGSRIAMTNAIDPSARGDAVIEQFVIDGDTMTQTQPASPGAEKTLRRTSAPLADAHPIIGEWTYPHPTGPAAFVRYSREGIVQLSVPFRTMKGTYRVDGDVLEVDLPGRPRTAFDIKREDRTLTLTERGGKGKISTYTKFEY
jgi:hypothetical protein